MGDDMRGNWLHTRTQFDVIDTSVHVDIIHALKLPRERSMVGLRLPLWQSSELALTYRQGFGW